MNALTLALSKGLTMKKLLIALLFVAMSVSSATAAMSVEHYSNACPAGSALTFYRVMIVYEDGCPRSAAGVDCEGKAWSVTFMRQNNPEPGQTVPVTWIQSFGANTMDVASTSSVDFRIINLKNGQFVDGNYHVNGEGHSVSVDISSLESSFYGVVASQNGTTISLTTFSK